MRKRKSSDKNEKYLKYIINLQQYKDIKELEPVFSFYNKPQEVAKALEAYEQLPKKEQGGTFTFMVGSVRLVSLEIVQEAVKKKYEMGIKPSDQKCAICGKSGSPFLMYHMVVSIFQVQTRNAL